MTDAERIARLEKTLGTLITWLALDLGADEVCKLIEMLTEEPKP